MRDVAVELAAVVVDDLKVAVGAVQANPADGRGDITVSGDRRPAPRAVVAFHLADARQRRPLQMAVGILHLGHPRRVGVGLQRRDGDAQRRGAFGRPLAQLIGGATVGVRVDFGHRVTGRRRHPLRNRGAQLP